jgi:hypothetical protein
MKKIKLETPCLVFKFKEHNKIKKKLMSLINNSKDYSLNNKNEYYSDLIHSLDFKNSSDHSREWVIYLRKYLEKYFLKAANKLGYQNIDVKNIWFQKYKKGGQHGWHIHGENYTGVYYLNFSKNSAKTELIEPFSQNKKIKINLFEGDIVMFPSYVVHRATEQKELFNKVIISFNIEFKDILPTLIKSFEKIKSINLI